MQKKCVHGTFLEYRGYGVMLIGPSGSGKSDLALRLIQRRGCLVSDDQVCLQLEDHELRGSPPETLKGLLEIRGIGIMKCPYQSSFVLHLVIDLGKGISYERFPEPQAFTAFGKKIPQFYLSAFEASILEKIDILLSKYTLLG